LLVNYQGFSRLRAESPRLQGPVLTYFAVSQPLGFTLPMPISTAPAAIVCRELAVQPGDAAQGTGSVTHFGGEASVKLERRHSSGDNERCFATAGRGGRSANLI
jgi:hypothetical protein